MTKYESTIKKIYVPVENVYAKLSDMTNMNSFQERLTDPTFIDTIKQGAAGKVSDDQLAQLVDIVSKLKFDRDSITMESGPLGTISLRIIEREEPKLVKFATENSPVSANLWVQLLPASDAQCAMKVTLGADLNFFLKQMLNSKLQDGVEHFADMLAMLPY